MKRYIALFTFTAYSFAQAQLVALPVQRIQELSRPVGNQQPLMDPVGPALPPEGSHEDTGDNRPPPPKSGVMLSDVMGRDRSINIFAGFTRDIESAANRLDDSSKNTTVLAPLNSAIEKLPRKPWEDPKDYNNLGSDAYEGEDGYERAQRNLRRFVEAHMIPQSPWLENQKVKPIGDDREVWWQNKDGMRVVSPIVSRFDDYLRSDGCRFTLGISKLAALQVQYRMAKL
jgi:paired amphipathic helix protein Sin3a